MKVATDRCPECGKRFFYYNPRERRYGKIVRTCKRCGRDYLDLRYHELALEGVPSSELSPMPYVFLMAIGGFVLYRGIHLFGMHTLGSSEVADKFLSVAFMLLGAAAIFGGLVEIVLVLTHAKERKFERLKAESRRRLLQPEYVRILRAAGYPVPDDIV